MSKDPFVREERGQTADVKVCPIIKNKCLGEKCQWWVMDYQEEKKNYRTDCAVAMIAKGITDETLLKLKSR